MIQVVVFLLVPVRSMQEFLDAAVNRTRDDELVRYHKHPAKHVVLVSRHDDVSDWIDRLVDEGNARDVVFVLEGPEFVWSNRQLCCLDLESWQYRLISS